MKKLLTLLFIATALFTACKEKKDPACPSVNAELVPTAVKDSLAVHFPGVMVETWYKVDAIGFCAKFAQAPNTVYAHFGTDGVLQEEEIVDSNGKEVDNDKEDEHDHEDEDTCECH